MKASGKSSLFQTASGRYQARIKDLKRKKLKLKAKLYLTIFLPAFLLVLLGKVLKVYLAIKIRALFTKPDLAAEKKTEKKITGPVPVSMTPVQKEASDLTIHKEP